MAFKPEYQLTEHQIELVKVDVDELRRAEGAQRGRNESRVKAIAAKFQLSAMGTVTSSLRADGHHYLVDGQHRTEADKLYIRKLESAFSNLVAEGKTSEAEAIRAQINKARMVSVEAHIGITEKDEATLFLIKNKESSKPGAVDEFIVGVNAGLEPYAGTWKVLQEHGLSVGKSDVPEGNDPNAVAGNRVTSVTNTVAVYEKWDTYALEKALTIAELAWGTPKRVANTWNGSLIGGLGMVYGTHNGVINDAVMVEKIRAGGKSLKGSGTDPQAWMKLINARAISESGYTLGSSPGRMRVAYEVFMEAYNLNCGKENRRKIDLASR